MLTKVVNILPVVSDADRCYLFGQPPCMGLLERLEATLARMRVSQREWARRAGLSDERHLGVIMSRLRRSPSADVERETIAALAKGAGVSLAWLATGQGTPDADDDARGPSVSESHVPHFSNALGWADARREAERRHPDIPAWAWEQAAGSAPMHLRHAVAPDQVVKLARMALELADPAVMSQALTDAQKRLAELEAQLAAKLAAQDAPSKPRKR